MVTIYLETDIYIVKWIFFFLKKKKDDNGLLKRTHYCTISSKKIILFRMKKYAKRLTEKLTTHHFKKQ